MKPSERAKQRGEEFELKILREYPDSKYNIRLSAFAKLAGQVLAILEYLDEQHKD